MQASALTPRSIRRGISANASPQMTSNPTTTLSPSAAPKRGGAARVHAYAEHPVWLVRPPHHVPRPAPVTPNHRVAVGVAGLHVVQIEVVHQSHQQAVSGRVHHHFSFPASISSASSFSA